jgi:hypothetical protein
MSYLYIRGRIGIADRLASGEPDAITYLGDTSDIELKLAAEHVENTNNNSAIASLDLRVAHTLNGTGTLKLKDDAATILKMALYGTEVLPAGGAFVAANAIFPTVVVGGTYRIPGGRRNLSSLVIVDSTGSPQTLTLGTHYTADLVNGTVTILSLSTPTMVQPLKASGTEATGQKQYPMLNARSLEKYLIVEGINIADSDKAVVVEIYRASFSPAASLMLKGTGNEPQVFEFEFAMLADPNRAASATLGRYGYYQKLS